MTHEFSICQPFLKWAGGKTQLLDTLILRLPTDPDSGSIRRYIEPFLGGGAVFFAVAERYGIEESFLFDVNSELVLTYRAVQQDVEGLIDTASFLSNVSLHGVPSTGTEVDGAASPRSS